VEHTRATDEPFDVISVGETMAAFVSRDDPSRFIATPAGAESNLAIGMARLGFRTRWVSRLGDDPLGDFVASTIAAAGVQVAAERDPDRVTGVMVKHVTESGSRVDYYRSESAARTLNPRDLEGAGSARSWHVTGITPALSASAGDLVRAIVGREEGLTGRVTFDVNLRPRLWSDSKTASQTLLPLARQADVVFVGDDEAEALFDTSDPQELRSLILCRDDQELVLKHGPAGASVVTLHGQVFEPALVVHVVDVTGAGDAFAAGYLAGLLWEWPAQARLRLGHLMASRVVGSIEDISPPFAPGALENLTPETLLTLDG
jgi:2-dehydro-3-deoxygluconokinase